MIYPLAQAMANAHSMVTALARLVTILHPAIDFATLLHLARDTVLVHLCREIANAIRTFMALTVLPTVLALSVTIGGNVQRVANVFAILVFLALPVTFVSRAQNHLLVV
jgi:hypothetical protein